MSAYPEQLLHWIWENLHFAHRQLRLPDGRKVTVLNPGNTNSSDGPDFLNAEIQIDTLTWYGDVEIHWNVEEWEKHGHQKDPNYNCVVLHVVYFETVKRVSREDGTKIPAICLKPYIHEPLNRFLSQYRTDPVLPCSGQISFISHEAFRQQLEKSHRAYFEQKVNDLISFYDPDLKPSEAWLKALSISLFDGLGISHNRRPMQQLAHTLFPLAFDIGSSDRLQKKALEIAGPISGYSGLQWNHKGCRPGNHPRYRILQGAEILWHIRAVPFETWFQLKPRKLWNDLTSSINTKPGLGHERSSILYGTVFLPALYALGNLFFSEKLKTTALSEWKNHHAHIPDSLLNPLKNTDLPAELYREKLGAVYQLRTYCKPRFCQQCEVFKSIISP